MASGLDLKNPGGKEILIVGGGAAGLALIYFALSKSSSNAPAQATPQSTPGTGGGLGSTGTASTTGGVGTAGFTPGNVFSDITSSVPASTATGSTGVSATPVPSVRGVSQGAGAILGSGGGSSSGPPVSGVSSDVAGVTVATQTVYNALRHAGLTAAEAAGVMGNIQNESRFRVDVSALDTNGKYSYGLVQWNAGSHPNASQFVTGNIAHDLQTQAAAIAAVVKGLGLGVSATAAQVAGAFASRFEVCQGCQPGQGQYNQRVANAQAFYNAIQAGKYNPPKATPKPSGTAGVKAAPAKQVQGLFPVVAPSSKPVANRQPVAKAKSKPLAGGVWASVVKAVTNPFPKLTAAIKPKPAARPATYSAGYRGEKRVGY